MFISSSSSVVIHRLYSSIQGPLLRKISSKGSFHVKNPKHPNPQTNSNHSSTLPFKKQKQNQPSNPYTPNRFQVTSFLSPEMKQKLSQQVLRSKDNATLRKVPVPPRKHANTRHRVSKPLNYQLKTIAEKYNQINHHYRLSGIECCELNMAIAVNNDNWKSILQKTAASSGTTISNVLTLDTLVPRSWLGSIHPRSPFSLANPLSRTKLQQSSNSLNQKSANELFQMGSNETLPSQQNSSFGFLDLSSFFDPSNLVATTPLFLMILLKRYEMIDWVLKNCPGFPWEYQHLHSGFTIFHIAAIASTMGETPFSQWIHELSKHKQKSRHPFSNLVSYLVKSCPNKSLATKADHHGATPLDIALRSTLLRPPSTDRVEETADEVVLTFLSLDFKVGTGHVEFPHSGDNFYAKPNLLHRQPRNTQIDSIILEKVDSYNKQTEQKYSQKVKMIQECNQNPHVNYFAKLDRPLSVPIPSRNRKSYSVGQMNINDSEKTMYSTSPGIDLPPKPIPLAYNSQDNPQDSPISHPVADSVYHAAACGGLSRVMKHLIKTHNHFDFEDRHPRYFCNATIFQCLAAYGHLNMFIEYSQDGELIRRDIDRLTTSQTPGFTSVLHLAAFYGQFQIVKHILSLYQDDLKSLLSKRDYYGLDPLTLAIIGDHSLIVYYLIMNEAQLDTNLIIRDRYLSFVHSYSFPFPKLEILESNDSKTSSDNDFTHLENIQASSMFNDPKSIPIPVVKTRWVKSANYNPVFRGAISDFYPNHNPLNQESHNVLKKNSILHICAALGSHKTIDLLINMFFLNSNVDSTTFTKLFGKNQAEEPDLSTESGLESTTQTISQPQIQTPTNNNLQLFTNMFGNPTLLYLAVQGGHIETTTVLLNAEIQLLHAELTNKFLSFSPRSSDQQSLDNIFQDTTSFLGYKFPVPYFMISQHGKSLDTLLHAAVRNLDVETTRLLLTASTRYLDYCRSLMLDHQQLVEKTDPSEIEVFIESLNIDIVEWVNKPNATGYTPLLLLPFSGGAQPNCLEITQLLFEHGAQIFDNRPSLHLDYETFAQHFPKHHKSIMKQINGSEFGFPGGIDLQNETNPLYSQIVSILFKNPLIAHKRPLEVVDPFVTTKRKANMFHLIAQNIGKSPPYLLFYYIAGVLQLFPQQKRHNIELFKAFSKLKHWGTVDIDATNSILDHRLEESVNLVHQALTNDDPSIADCEDLAHSLYNNREMIFDDGDWDGEKGFSSSTSSQIPPYFAQKIYFFWVNLFLQQRLNELVNSKNQFGLVPMYYAVVNQHPSLFKTFYYLGADFSVSVGNGNNLFHILATINGKSSDEIVQFMLETSSTSSSSSSSSTTQTKRAIFSKNDQNSTPFDLAVRHKNFRVVDRILEYIHTHCPNTNWNTEWSDSDHDQQFVTLFNPLLWNAVRGIVPVFVSMMDFFMSQQLVSPQRYGLLAKISSSDSIPKKTQEWLDNQKQFHATINMIHPQSHHNTLSQILNFKPSKYIEKALVLLYSGADYTNISTFGWNSLHYAASNGATIICRLIMSIHSAIVQAQKEALQKDRVFSLFAPEVDNLNKSPAWYEMEEMSEVSGISQESEPVQDPLKTDELDETKTSNNVHTSKSLGQFKKSLYHILQPQPENPQPPPPLPCLLPTLIQQQPPPIKFINQFTLDVGGWTPLHLAIRSRTPHTVDFLLNHDADMTLVTQKRKLTIFHINALNPNLQVLHILLGKSNKNRKFLINKREQSRGYTPIHYSAIYGHIDLCQILLVFGAQLMKPTHMGANTLHLAAQHHNLEILKLCVEYLNHPHNFSRLFFDSTNYTAKETNDSSVSEGEESPTPLNSQWSSQAEIILKETTEQNIEPISYYLNQTDMFGFSPVATAIKFGDLKCAEYLISLGGEISPSATYALASTNDALSNILHVAIFSGNIAVLSFVTDYCVSQNSFASLMKQSNHEGKNPVEYANLLGYPQLAKYLAQK